MGTDHHIKFLCRHKLCGKNIQRLNDEAPAIKRWPLTPGYVLRPDGIPVSESATEQAYEIFNGITEEAEYLAKHHHPRQVLFSILASHCTGFKGHWPFRLPDI